MVFVVMTGNKNLRNLIYSLKLYSKLYTFFLQVYTCTYLIRYIEGLAEMVVQSGDDIAKLYEQGNRVRRMASTDKSPSSSRFL